MIAFLNNPMLSATENSFLKALRASTYHDNALFIEKANPFILSLYTRFHVLHLALRAAFEAWDLQGGQQQGTTLTLQQLMNLLNNTKIRDWDVALQSKYNKTTAEYKTILPNNRAPFQTGTQLERLTAVKVLSDAVGNYPSLAELKTDIDTFNTQLKTAYDLQKGNITLTKSKSEVVEAARVAMCIGQYANLGALMQEHAANPEYLLKYFDQSVLSNGSQTIFTGLLKPVQVYTIVKHTFGVNDQISLTNSGNSILKFYLAAERDIQPGTQFINLPHGKQIVLASALGNLTDSYLTVFNTDPLLSGNFEIEIL